MSFFWGGPPVFLPNRVVFGSFLPVKLFYDLQVVIHEQVASSQKTAIFQKNSLRSSK
jgi:hypothetical protein